MTSDDDDYERLTKAILFATMAHGTRTDRGGQPFIGHPLRVMAKLAQPTINVNVLIAAMLHDVVEDEDVTLFMIGAEFGGEILDAVDALSKREEETYFNYIRRCRKNNIANAVKLADLEDNTNPQRAGYNPHLAIRYTRAIELLSEPRWSWEKETESEALTGQA